MENGDWAIPFSCCFVMKTMREYLPEECSITVLFTMIMRIKFTGLPELQQVMEFCTKEKVNDENYSHEAVFGQKAFRCRANEEEGEIIDNDSGRSGKYNIVKSSDFKDFYNEKETKGDMLQFTLRVN